MITADKFEKHASTQSTSPLQRCLNMVNHVEDMVSTFQSAHTSPKSQMPRPKKTKKAKVLEKSYEIIPSLKKAVEILTSRLSTAVPKCTNMPNIRRFRPGGLLDFELGPGCYHEPHKSIQPEQDLLTVPRLEDKYLHRLKIMQRRKHSLPHVDLTNITIFNESLVNSPRNFQEKAKIRKEKIEIVQTAAKEIKRFFHEEKQFKLNQKLERIQWLEKKEEILALKKNWRKVISRMSIASLLHLKILNYKVKHMQNIKKRSRKLLSFLFFASKFLGKIVRYVVRKRKILLYKVFFI